jgi:Lysylphosphatidylglycerol synthase TM region
VAGSGSRGQALRRAFQACAYVAGAAALFWLLRSTDLAAVAATLRTVGPLALLVLVPLGLQIALEAVSWRLLLARLGRRVGLALSWRVNVQAEAIRLSFPGGPPLAEATRPALFARLGSVPLGDAATALVARKLCHMSTQGAYLGTGLVLGGALFERWARALGPAGRSLPALAWAVAAGLTAAALSMGTLLAHGSIASRAERLLARLRRGRVASRLEARRARFAALDGRIRLLLARSPRTMAWNLLTGAGGWFLDAAETLLVLRLVGFQVTPGEALGVEALASVVRIAAFAVPGGLGIQDFAYHALLQGTVSDTASMSFILLKRARDVFWVATGLLLPLLLDRVFFRARASTGSEPARTVIAALDGAAVVPTPPSSPTPR